MEDIRKEKKRKEKRKEKKTCRSICQSSAFACIKSTIETLEEGVKYVQS